MNIYEIIDFIKYDWTIEKQQEFLDSLLLNKNINLIIPIYNINITGKVVKTQIETYEGEKIMKFWNIMFDSDETMYHLTTTESIPNVNIKIVK